MMIVIKTNEYGQLQQLNSGYRAVRSGDKMPGYYYRKLKTALNHFDKLGKLVITERSSSKL